MTDGFELDLINQSKPSYILRSGNTLRRSASSACGSNKTFELRPNSLFSQYPVIRNRGDFIRNGTNKKNELVTIDEKTLNIDENTCYVIQVGCNNWLGRSE